MDRIDIQKEVHPVDFFAIADQKAGVSSEELRTKVERAREIQQERYAQESGINCNAQMTTELIQKYCILEADSLKILRETSEKYGYSARVIHKLLRLARTSADLDGEEKIRRKDIEKVLTCRDLDKSNSTEQLAEISDLSVRQRESIIRNHSLEKAKRIFEECQNKNIFVLCWDDDRYLARAKKPTDAPVVLYYKGNFREMDQTIGIIGARRCSQESKQKTVFLASECAQKKITVVSGMAKGIDSYAHTVCLNTGGYTVAILGNGLDICYPAEHNKLMKCIEEKGLLISEYPPGTHPDRYRFPRRNRLISSWSDKLFVIQAEKGSGALITAEYSRKYGREVEME